MLPMNTNNGINGRQIIHITTSPAPNPFLPSTLTCVCNDGTVWTKQDAPLINMFGAFMGNSHSEWTQVSAPPQPIIMQPVMIPQPVVQPMQALPIQQYAQHSVPQQMLPHTQAQVVYPQWQPQPQHEQNTVRSEYRYEQGQQGQDKGQTQDRDQQRQGREQKHAMAGD
jgi:hypothetical protein